MAAMRVRVEAHCAVRRVLLEGRARRILRHNAGFKQLSVRQGDFVSFFREKSKHKHTGVWSGPAEVLKVLDGGAHVLFQGSVHHVPLHLCVSLRSLPVQQILTLTGLSRRTRILGFSRMWTPRSFQWMTVSLCPFPRLRFYPSPLFLLICLAPSLALWGLPNYLPLPLSLRTTVLVICPLHMYRQCGMDRRRSLWWCLLPLGTIPRVSGSSP